MDFILDNIFEIVIGVVVALYILRAFVTHKTIDQRMEETINDPNFDPMAYHSKKQADRSGKEAGESKSDS